MPDDLHDDVDDDDDSDDNESDLILMIFDDDGMINFVR